MHIKGLKEICYIMPLPKSQGSKQLCVPTCRQLLESGSGHEFVRIAGGPTNFALGIDRSRTAKVRPDRSPWNQFPMSSADSMLLE